ncbi:MAG TPA: helix-turn-helix transcriptional regulator [Gemmatimonadota bacterium]|nr:helix-turn-helix transcriptional regulator [Gemmatimonadota bacterium]
MPGIPVPPIPDGDVPDRAPRQILSDRERQVVGLTAGGYSSREIGERLRISSKTVDTYRARSMEKLGFSHRSELVLYALRTGLLEGR